MATALATALSQAGLQTSNFNSTDRPRCDKEKSSNGKGKVSFISSEEARQYNDYHQKKFNHSFQEPYQCPHFSGLNAHWHLRTVGETDPLAHTPTGFTKTNFDLSKGTATKSEKVLTLLKDSTTRTYQEIANLVGCSDALVYVVSRENGLTRGIGRPRKTTAATQVKPAMTPAEIRAQAAKLLEEADRIENEQREKLRVQLKPTQDGKILIWMNGQGITGTHEQMNQLRVLLSAGIPTPFAGNEDAAMSQMFAATVAAGV